MKSIKLHLHPFPCLLLLLLNLPLQAQADCDCTADTEPRGKSSPLPLKLIALASILTAGAMGVLIPILGRSISVLQPEHDMFFVIKAFAAGVILATGLIHILPDGFERLTSPCLGGDPRSRFPFAGFIAMLSAMGTMMVDALATGFYSRSSNLSKAQPVEEDDEMGQQSGHAHGHSHGSSIVVSPDASLSERIRQRVISQGVIAAFAGSGKGPHPKVLELGILVHSVIIGLSLGASQRSSTIRPLVGALSFHQFFEGIGLGGCIVQANFKARATVIMAIFFSLTAPLGIAVGIGISSGYDANSSTALILEGVLNSASAGILIYMALVNLLAADFMNSRMQSNGRLQLGANVALILGSGCMSILAKWA